MDRLFRLLLDPAAPTSPVGGANPAAPAAAAPAATPPAPVSTTPPASPDPVKPPDVPLPFEEVQRLFAADRKLREVEAEKAQALEKKEQERILAMAKAGEAEKAVEEQKARYEGKISELQTAFHNALKLTELSNATAAVGFVSTEAASQARAIMAARLEVRQEGDSLKIVDKATGRPAVEAVKAWLGTAEFAHFQKPSTQGGSNAGGSDLTTASTDPSKAPKLAWADLAILKAAEQAAAPSSNPYSPTGLRSRIARN